MYNFVPQLATWRVVSGGSVFSHDPPSYIHQSQLAMRRVVAHSCTFLCIHSITQTFEIPNIFHIIMRIYINLFL